MDKILGSGRSGTFHAGPVRIGGLRPDHSSASCSAGLLYVAVIVLARRDNAWGLGAGAIVAAFWNYMNLFVSNFIVTGLRQLSLLLTTGELRPGQIAVVAAIGHFLFATGPQFVGILRQVFHS